jgi:PKD repeat protein
MKRGSFTLFILCVVIFIAGCNSDSDNNPGPTPNPQPTISSFSPNQVSRGQQNVEGRIQGTNLGSVNAVNLGPGLTVVRFTSISASEIEVIFNVQNNAAVGTRTITITTSAGSISSSTVLSVTNNRAPVAKFTVTPSSGAENTLFTVDATDSDDPDGQIRTYHWDFGDNKTATGRIAEHKFGANGTFQITLTITDNDGATSLTRKQVEVQRGNAPVARFTVTPPSGDVGTRFVIDGTGSTDDGRITNFEWRLGDGTVRTGSAITHVYRTGGTFTIQLTVTDNTGLSSVREQGVRVERFNQNQAEEEVRRLLDRFFTRFDKIERFSTEDIVDGWSTSPQCRGRDHEIRIIERQKEIIAENSVDVVDMDILIKPNGLDGNATVRAKFEWREKDGDTGKSDVVHHFTVIFEDGEWQICNFTLENLSTEARKLFLMD